METIVVKNYIDTAFSLDDAKRLQEPIESALQSTSKINIDFTGIEYFTTLFFNNAITKYVVRLKPDEYKMRINIVGLSELGKTTYSHSYDNALDYYNTPPSERTIKEEILQNIDE